jgi:glutathione synthase/RimK-type ligase-like ATP-grasp enzyme
MKYIAIYVSHISDAKHGPQFKEPVYSKAYPQLFSLLYQNGATPVIVHNQKDTYKGKGTFSEYWLPIFTSNNECSGYDHIESDITVSFVYDKGRFEADDVQMINSVPVRDVCKDKYLSYLFLPELHPNSYLIANEQQLQAYITSQSNKNIVLKEVDSNSGKAVYIGGANAYTNNLAFPLLAQEFIETIGGYGDIVGRHDMRVVIFDGEIIQGRLRKPPMNEYIANISYGGENRVLHPQEIPNEVIDIIASIDKKIQLLPGSEHRFYSADFGHNGKEWALFELNAWPGLVDCEAGEAEKESMNTLAKRLISCLD